MKIWYGVRDIFALPKALNDAVCVMTNGMVKTSGVAVMGAGIAKQASMRFDGLAQDLGMLLSKYGNQAYDMGSYKDNISDCWIRIITFPTKYPWRERADLDLIKVSAEQLLDICNQNDITRCYMPCPGCGKGGLDWKNQVRPLLDTILDDRFIIADYNIRDLVALPELIVTP